mgnify:CR=1 FL=1
MYDVTATGELLIDFTRNGLSEQNNRIYEANPGGAPCNVLAMLGKLGYKTAFIGKVGNDEFCMCSFSNDFNSLIIIISTCEPFNLIICNL